jgi:hypothetical protein
MVEKVGELELGDELPEGKLQESEEVENEWDSRCRRMAPKLPLYKVRGQGVYKEEGLSDWRVVSLREGPS